MTNVYFLNSIVSSVRCSLIIKRQSAALDSATQYAMPGVGGKWGTGVLQSERTVLKLGSQILSASPTYVRNTA